MAENSSAPGPNEVRSLDGSGNNLTHPDWGIAGGDLLRVGPANYVDGVSVMRTDLPNPREISNVVVAQTGDLPAPGNGSAYMYAWGQFLDHDLSLTSGNDSAHADIVIPAGDPFFPDGSIIPFQRSQTDPHSGTGPDDPLTPVNAITPWMDGSQIYGSTADQQVAVRGDDGRLKTSAGDNLPINPTSGGFIAGDVRVGENPELTGLQTLFAREHNWQVDLMHQQHPEWSAEQLFRTAKAIVSGELQHITYDEYLPHLLGDHALPKYHGYDSEVNPDISMLFSTVAFRFGHSMVSDEIPTQNGDVPLSQTFGEPAAKFIADGGLDPVLRGMAEDGAQAVDVHIVDSLRNLLVDEPGRMDLAALNIQRARDQGIPSYNDAREAVGLHPVHDFSEITSDVSVQHSLAQVYGSVDKVDAWVGGLAEDHVAGSQLGGLFQAVLVDQFTRTRDGDRFYYERDLDHQTVKTIQDTSLSDIIQRNTDITNLQRDVFIEAAATDDHGHDNQGQVGQHGDGGHDFMFHA